MRRLKSIVATAAFAAQAFGLGTAEAALHARAGGMVYDDVFDITWIADLNFYSSYYFNGDKNQGRADWYTATSWTENLSYGGFNDWRLPTLNPNDPTCLGPSWPFPGAPVWGKNCRDGELSHLFVEYFGLVDRRDGSPSRFGNDEFHRSNIALFGNADDSELAYWSSTPSSGPGFNFRNKAMIFELYYANQVSAISMFQSYSIAIVRDGDVSAVPEPQADAMLVAGLGIITVAARRRKLR